MSYVSCTVYFSLTDACVDTKSVADVLCRHVTACRRLPGLEKALAIIVPEANMPHIAMSLREEVQEVRRLPAVLFMMEDSKGHGQYRDTAGSITTERNKREAVEMLRELYLKPGQLGFHAKFVCVHFDVGVGVEVKEMLVAHLRNYKFKRIAYKDHGGATRYEIYYSGKWTGDKNDDFVSAILIAVYNKREFWLDKEHKYRQYQLLGEQ